MKIILTVLRHILDDNSSSQGAGARAQGFFVASQAGFTAVRREPEPALSTWQLLEEMSEGE